MVDPRVYDHQGRPFRPMGAVNAPVGYAPPGPVLVSRKLDGIRCICLNGIAYSKNLEPIPNKFVQRTLSGLHGPDGELIVGSPTDPRVWNNSQSGIMSEDGFPDFTFYIFDYVSDLPARQRLAEAHRLAYSASPFDRRLRVVENEISQSPVHLDAIFARHLAEGYEGSMMRAIASPYKYGKATLKEGFLLKRKPLLDGEAEILDVYPSYTNANPQIVKATGTVKRGKSKENLIPNPIAGSLRVRDLITNKVFRIGSGISDEDAHMLWSFQTVGKIITYTYVGTTSNGLPKNPVYKGIRNRADM